MDSALKKLTKKHSKTLFKQAEKGTILDIVFAKLSINNTNLCTEDAWGVLHRACQYGVDALP